MWLYFALLFTAQLGGKGTLAADVRPARNTAPTTASTSASRQVEAAHPAGPPTATTTPVQAGRAATPPEVRPVLDGTWRLHRRRPRLEAAARASQRRQFSGLRASATPGDADGRTAAGLRPGDRRTFVAFDFGANRYREHEAQLQALGQRVAVWIALDAWHQPGLASSPTATAARVADVLDQRILPTCERWFGTVWLPPGLAAATDEPARIHVLLMDITDDFGLGYIAGYFNTADLDPEAPWSNRQPVIFMDVGTGDASHPERTDSEFTRTLVHEIQHLINHSRHRRTGVTEERWLDEGLATFAEWVYSATWASIPGHGKAPSPHLARFLADPTVSLTENRDEVWLDEARFFAQYGASFLFVFHLVDTWGGATDEARADFVRRLVDRPETGVAAINAMLTPLGADAGTAIRDWMLANHLADPDINGGRWGYRDALARLGPQAQGLATGPLAGRRHLAIAAQRTAHGGAGTVQPNAGNYEVFQGAGRLTLGLRDLTGGLTPFLATIDRAGGTTGRHLPLDATGCATITVDLDGLERAVLLPVQISLSTGEAAPPVDYRFDVVAPTLRLQPVPHPVFDDGFLVLLQTDAPIVGEPVVTLATARAEEPIPMLAVDAGRRLFAGSGRLPTGGGWGMVTAVVASATASFSFAGGPVGDAVVAGLRFRWQSAPDTRPLLLAEAPARRTPTHPELTLRSTPFFVRIPPGGSVTIALPTERRGSGTPIRGLGLWTTGDAGERWIAPTPDPDGGWRATLDRDGDCVLVSDQTPPTIADPVVVQDTITGLRLLTTTVTDHGAGVDPDSIRVWLAGPEVGGSPRSANDPARPDPDSFETGIDANLDPLPAEFDPSRGALRVTLPAGMTGSTLRLRAADRAGNATQRAALAGSAHPSTIPTVGCFLAAPSPARHRTRLELRLHPPPDRAADVTARVDVCDHTGHRVRRLWLERHGDGGFREDWDLRDERGQIVANGVYCCRARITIDGRRLPTTQTWLAVLR